MLHIIGNTRRSAVAAAVPLLLAVVLLAACGSSSSNSASSTGASASTSTGSSTATSPTGPPNGAGGGRFAGLRTCLQKEGITLPKRTPGQGAPGGGGGLLGGGGGGTGRALPAGVTRAQFEAALKKCGGTPGGGFGRGAGRFSTPAAKAALVKFAACMRENGQNVPAPNTSGKGPVFNTKGLNTSSAAFKAAQSKCSSLLSGVLGRAGGGTAPPAAG